mgnify:CR=1 FL=1
MRRSNRVYWIDHAHWGCGRHLPAGVLPATIERCWLCPNKRPPMSCRPEPPKDGSSISKVKTEKTKARRPARPKMIVARKAADLTAHEPPATQAKTPSKPAASSRKNVAKSNTRTAAPKKASARKAAPPAAGSGGICAWHECCKPARPRSKYCSRNCSNKNARARHKARK